MAKFEDEKSAFRRVLADMANMFSDFFNLDLRSRSAKDNEAKEEFWSLRKALVYVVGISLLLWGVTFLVLQLLFRH